MKKPTGELLDSLKNAESIDEYLANNSNEMLFDKLEDWIDFHILTKNLSKADVIERSQISRTYAYQIIKGVRKPSRDKLLMLCFGLELSQEETNQILKKNGYPALYPRDMRDSVILFALMHGLDVIKTNLLLHDKDLKVLV